MWTFRKFAKVKVARRNHAWKGIIHSSFLLNVLTKELKFVFQRKQDRKLFGLTRCASHPILSSIRAITGIEQTFRDDRAPSYRSDERLLFAPGTETVTAHVNYASGTLVEITGMRMRCSVERHLRPPRVYSILDFHPSCLSTLSAPAVVFHYWEI